MNSKNRLSEKSYPLTQFALVMTCLLSRIVPPQRRAFFDSKITIATHVNSPNPVPSGAFPLGCVFCETLKYKKKIIHYSFLLPQLTIQSSK